MNEMWSSFEVTPLGWGFAAAGLMMTAVSVLKDVVSPYSIAVVIVGVIALCFWSVKHSRSTIARMIFYTVSLAALIVESELLSGSVVAVRLGFVGVITAMALFLLASDLHSTRAKETSRAR